MGLECKYLRLILAPYYHVVIIGKSGFGLSYGPTQDKLLDFQNHISRRMRKIQSEDLQLTAGFLYCFVACS